MSDERLRWRVYVRILGLLYVVMYAVTLPRFRLLYIPDLVLTIPSYAGVWAFAHRRRFGSRMLWRFLAIAFPVWDVVFNFFLSRDALEDVGATVIAAAMILVLAPAYVALWRYAFASPEIWREN